MEENKKSREHLLAEIQLLKEKLAKLESVQQEKQQIETKHQKSEEVLEMLKAELNPDFLKGSDPNETYYNLGRRDAIVYINQLLRYDE